jgi:hypothetical protein
VVEVVLQLGLIFFRGFVAEDDGVGSESMGDGVEGDGLAAVAGDGAEGFGAVGLGGFELARGRGHGVLFQDQFTGGGGLIELTKGGKRLRWKEIELCKVCHS